MPTLERPSHPKAQNFFQAAYVGRSTLKSAQSARSISQHNIKSFQPNRLNFVRSGRGRFNEELPQAQQWEERSQGSRRSAGGQRPTRNQPAKARATFEEQFS